MGDQRGRRVPQHAQVRPPRRRLRGELGGHQLRQGRRQRRRRAPAVKWLKSEIMIPAGDLSDTKGNGCADIDALILPRGGFGGTTVSLWTPVCRSDITWNFEKFLVDKSGKVVKRFSRYYDTNAIASDIDALL